MTRPKEFDVDQVLAKATELFWRQGYDGTSMHDLQAELGIGRQSLYNTFGDKHQLFLRAIDRYVELNRQRTKELLGKPDASLPEIREYLHALVDTLSCPGERKACLLTNSILERAQIDDELAGRCRLSQEQLSAAFQGALENAMDKGELSRERPAAELALFLVNQIYGLSVLSKTGASKKSLRATAELALSALT